VAQIVFSKKIKYKELILCMFLRTKKNRSGSTSIVVVSKENGVYREIHSVGTSSDERELSDLWERGRYWIRDKKGFVDMFDNYEQEQLESAAVEHFFNNVRSVLLNGMQLILNPVFKQIGFNRINDDMLKDLAVSRICRPMSKVATVDYLKDYFGEDVELHKIYRYLDTLNSSQKEYVQDVSVGHTLKLLGGGIGIVFYDVTTLYFETDNSDDLRKTGFSKDGKHSHPQILLGLLVSKGGYPLAYSIHEGNKYEGHTMLPIINAFITKYNVKDFIVVADSGLMTNANIEMLEKENHKYILGARIKNESTKIQSWILSQEKTDGSFYEYKKDIRTRLIVGYSDSRAKKDAHNRDKGVRRLEKEYANRIITKDKINKRGYNKFLDIEDDIRVHIDYDKINADKSWDGFKGYITNTDLSPQTIYEQYSDLWQVERAFRITKGTLELRPMFHFTKERIEAHVCICFVAYKVYKELERILKLNAIALSVDKVLDIARTITTIVIKDPQTKKTISRTMLLTDKHKSIAKLYDKNFWKNNSTRIE
jgi:transposase